jgi:hypothetical protein
MYDGFRSGLLELELTLLVASLISITLICKGYSDGSSIVRYDSLGSSYSLRALASHWIEGSQLH